MTASLILLASLPNGTWDYVPALVAYFAVGYLLNSPIMALAAFLPALLSFTIGETPPATEAIREPAPVAVDQVALIPAYALMVVIGVLARRSLHRALVASRSSEDPGPNP